MKILVVITGGTIGSTTNDSVTSLDVNKNYALIEHYKSKFADDITFETVSPYRILSENITATELNKLIDAVELGLKGDYQGIIITHGTDTLQYTSAALAYCFANAKKPIVVVSANYPLDNEKSNGHYNFEAAVKFIESQTASGVFASYKNTKSDTTDIHVGTRMYSHLENTDEVYSINEQIFATYKDGVVTKNEDYIETNRSNDNTKYRFVNETGILVISSIPGDSFNYDLSNAKAVIIRPYHSGTINTADGGLEKFCEKAKALRVPMFILHSGLGADYESTTVFDNYGITALKMSTFVSQYMKLWIATSNNLDIKEFMKTEIAQEYVKSE